MNGMKPKPPYLVVAERDEKLKAALYGAVEEMAPGQSRVEIEGAGGLALRFYTQAKEAGRGPDGRTLYSLKERQMYLQLVDREGTKLASAVSAGYPKEKEWRPEEIVALQRWLVGALVEGGVEHRALDTVLDMRQMAARLELNKARDAAARLPDLERDLVDAEMAFSWAEAVQAEQVAEELAVSL